MLRLTVTFSTNVNSKETLGRFYPLHRRQTLMLRAGEYDKWDDTDDMTAGFASGQLRLFLSVVGQFEVLNER